MYLRTSHKRIDKKAPSLLPVKPSPPSQSCRAFTATAQPARDPIKHPNAPISNSQMETFQKGTMQALLLNAAP